MTRLTLAALLVVAVAVRPASAAHQPCASTQTLACGETRAGTLAAPDQTDCLIVVAASRQVLSITTAGGAGLFVPCWRLLDADETPLGPPLACGQEEVELPAAGTYTLQVFDGDHAESGTYTVTREVVSSASDACAAPIGCGASIGAEIGSAGTLVGETDTFTFEGREGETVSITVAGGGGPFVPCWTLFDPAGGTLGFPVTCGQGERTIEAPGAHTIKVFDDDHRDTGRYSLALEVVSDTAGTCAEPVGCGETLARDIGVAEALLGDTDTFRLAGTAGDVVSITTAGGSGLFLPCWTLFDPDGNHVGFPVSCGTDERELPAGGRYTIKVFDNNHRETGRYTLTVEFVSGASACGEPITCGSHLGREIAPVGESDAYGFAGVAGQVVSVTTAGASGRFLPCWTLFAPDGTPVGFPTACGQEERVLPATGSYRIRVFDNNDAETGSYAIGLEVVSGATADPRCSEPLACGQTVERAVDAPGETDTFRFPGLAGQVVTIATAPASGLFLPCWELFAPDGSPVGGFRSCGEEARTLPVSGAYTIKVFDNNHREGGAYAVSLEGCGAVTTTTLAGSSTTTLPAYALRRTLRPPAAGAPEEELGAAVAFAATDVLIGAPHDETGGRDAGAVFVVEATGDPGSPDFGRLRRTLLAPAPLAGDRFGAAVVAVGADVAVGAPGDDAGGDDAGAVYVFGGRDGALLGRLVAASATPGGRFGESLAVRGAELVVGAPGAHASAVAGAGRVYVLVGATGQERLVLEDPETPDSGDAFGFALAGAGAMLAVGAPGDGGGTGSVFLFDAQSGAPLRTLRQPSGARGDGFGSAVGVLGDRILVGAPGAARDTGKAFLFDARTGALLRTFEKRSPQPGDRFGATVALTERGALIAAPTDRREVEAGGAVYLVDVETGAPLQVFQKEHPEPRDLFGSALAAAGDGLLIGAPFDDSGLVNGGAAYLFRGDAIAAVFRKRFPGADFGAAVAGAGGALLVGAPLDGERRGAVHVFDAGSGEARAMLTPELAGGARFGFSLATAGTATVVGAPFASVGGVEAGSVAVFADTTVRARLSGPSPRAGDQLGFAVATVDADVLVGAPLVGERDEGEAYLYDRASGELERTLRKPTATSGDFFGAAVAGAGDALVIGAPFDGAAAPSAGAAYVFGRRDGTLRALLASPAPAPGDQLGAAVAASATRIVVGAPLADAAVPDGGAVHVFDATTHALLFSVSNPAARPGDQFGTAVALADGNVLVGAPLADGGAVDTGAAYVFDGSTGALLQALPNPAQAAFDRFGFAVAGVPEGLLIGAPGPSVAYLFARAGFAAQAAGITPLAAPGGERCGNGIVEAAEECDDGNAVDTDDCRLGCRRPICCIIDPQAEQRCDDRNQCTDDRLDPVVGCVHTPNGRCCGVDADCPGGKCRLCNGCFIHEWACCESGSECVSPPDCSARSCFDATRCVCQGELECAAEPLPAVVRERFREACDRLRLMESIATEQAGAGRHGLKTTARLGRKARRLMKSAQRTARVSAKREGLSKACRKALLKRMRQAIKAVPVRKLRRCLPLDRTTARHTVAPSGVSQSESNTGGRTR